MDAQHVIASLAATLREYQVPAHVRADILEQVARALTEHKAEAPTMTFDEMVKELHQTSYACPVMYSGFLHNDRAFNFRYRHGVATLILDNPGSRTRTEYGDDMDGALSHTEFKQLFMELYAQGTTESKDGS